MILPKVHELFAMTFGQFGQEYTDKEKSMVTVQGDLCVLKLDMSKYEEGTIGALIGDFYLTCNAKNPTIVSVNCMSKINYSVSDKMESYLMGL